MHEPLLDRIQELERSNRRWKAACAILAAALLAVLTSGVAWVGIYGYQALARNQAMRAAEEARMQEMRARAAAEAAQQKAAEALEKAGRIGDPK